MTKHNNFTLLHFTQSHSTLHITPLYAALYILQHFTFLQRNDSLLLCDRLPSNDRLLMGDRLLRRGTCAAHISRSTAVSPTLLE